jgi:hypothetical protein
VNERVRTDGRLVVVAPALDGDLQIESRRELDAIARQVGSRRVAVLDGARATKRAVQSHASGATVLHFVAHARANDHDPASS